MTEEKCRQAARAFFDNLNTPQVTLLAGVIYSAYLDGKKDGLNEAIAAIDASNLGEKRS